MKVRPAVVFLVMSLVLTAGCLCHAQQPLCIFTADPTILYFEPEGGKAEVNVVASSPRCSLSVLTTYPWITIAATATEEPDKWVVTVRVTAIHELSQRVGDAMVGETKIEIVQRVLNSCRSL